MGGHDVLNLARGTLDPGIFSDEAPTMEAFYIEKVGIPFEEHLRHSPTYGELMFSLPEGKLKIQASGEAMEPAVTGYRSLLVARQGRDQVHALVDPDGNSVQLVPPGHRGVSNIGVECVVADAAAQERFLVEGMGAEATDGGFRVGNTMLFVTEDPSVERPTPPWRRGFTYLTVITHEAQRTHDHLVASGGEHSLRVLRLLDRCLFSWLRDPSGNWIEVVQYAELSGPLPDIARIADHWEEVTKWREEAVAY